MPLEKLPWLATVITAALVGCVPGLNSTNKRVATIQRRTPDVQAERYYPTVLERLLPSGQVSPENFPKNIRWMATVRILPPYERPEYRFSMQETYDGEVIVSVTRPRGSSVFVQLKALTSKYPTASLERFLRSISIEQWAIRQTGESKLGQLAREFAALRISPVLPDELGVDDTGYEFWSQSLWGNRMSVRLSGPGPEAKKQPHPLLAWAETVRSFIESSRPRER